MISGCGYPEDYNKKSYIDLDEEIVKASNKFDIQRVIDLEILKEMRMINYKSGDLFKGSSEESYKIHSVNCCGIWGSGIAKTFKERYPKAFEEYKKDCANMDLLGFGMIYDSNVVALYTSRGYGATLDPKEYILDNTYEAFRNLLMRLKELPEVVLNMPKINSGLFRVPWEETEKVLLKVLTEFKEKCNFTPVVNVWTL
jgi:ADP-ribose 1''-phosphate phosphatase